MTKVNIINNSTQLTGKVELEPNTLKANTGYAGLETDTATTTIDNCKRTVKVDVNKNTILSKKEAQQVFTTKHELSDALLGIDTSLAETSQNITQQVETTLAASKSEINTFVADQISAVNTTMDEVVTKQNQLRADVEKDYQKTLVGENIEGQNIKTINGASVLGAGDITIECKNGDTARVEDDTIYFEASVDSKAVGANVGKPNVDEVLSTLQIGNAIYPVRTGTVTAEMNTYSEIFLPSDKTTPIPEIFFNTELSISEVNALLELVLPETPGEYGDRTAIICGNDSQEGLEEGLVCVNEGPLYALGYLAGPDVDRPVYIYTSQAIPGLTENIGWAKASLKFAKPAVMTIEPAVTDSLKDLMRMSSFEKFNLAGGTLKQEDKEVYPKTVLSQIYTEDGKTRVTLQTEIELKKKLMLGNINTNTSQSGVTIKTVQVEGQDADLTAAIRSKASVIYQNCEANDNTY